MRRLLAAVLAAHVVAALTPATAAADGDWRWPIRGDVLTSYRFGEDPYARGQHRGMDIASPVGSRVVAAASGTVRFAGVAGSSGLTVSVRTADGRFDTSYLHLSAIHVSAGSRVAAGDPIGVVGMSGRRSAEAAHLHFGVRLAGSRHGYRDPLHLLPPVGGVRDTPRGAPFAVVSPVRIAPEPEPVRFPRRAPVLDAVGERSKLGWALACTGLLLVSVLLGGRLRVRRPTGSSIGVRAVLRHNADLLRQR